MEILTRSFYEADTVDIARALLGKVIVRIQDGERLSGRIVETEAYKKDDPACHAFRGKTPRNSPMFGPAGFTYVYFSYGVHDMLNAVTQPAGTGEAVLIRALEPLTGVDTMRRNAGVFDDYPAHQLLRGPGKLTKSMAIERVDSNNLDLTDPVSPISIWSNGEADLTDDHIVVTPRIGISKAVDLPWRFTVRGSLAVSRR